MAGINFNLDGDNRYVNDIQHELDLIYENKNMEDEYQRNFKDCSGSH